MSKPKSWSRWPLAALCLTVLFLTVLGGACAGRDDEPGSVPGAEDEELAVEEDSELSMNVSFLRGRGERGQLIDSSYLRTLSPAKVRAALADAGFDSKAVTYGVDLHQLLYSTLDAHGKPTQATGLIALPRRAKRLLTLVSYAHGTELSRDDAPSVAEDSWGPAPALVYASAGFVAVAPDYLGLGDGPGLHPWMHVPSEVSASHDLLRAAHSFAWQHGRLLRRSVLITGFSQGSFAALGLAHALARGDDDWFRLGAVAPVSGPYDFRGFVRAAASGLVMPKAATVYLGYLSVAWNRIDPFYSRPSDFFLAPYAQFVHGLFDGSHPGHEVVDRLPDAPADLFTAPALALLREPSGALARAFLPFEGLCGGFEAGTRVALFAAQGDDEVPFAQSVQCKEALRASGADTSLEDVGDVGHIVSHPLSTSKILELFRGLSAP